MLFESFDGIHDACFCPGWSIRGLRASFGRKAILSKKSAYQKVRGQVPTREYGYLPQHNAIHNISIPEIDCLEAISAQFS
jgi:hypothetical protein